MLQIDDTVISFDLLEDRFLCDLVTCKGSCCVEGDSGAPLEDEEIEILQKLLPVVWNDLSDVSKKVINKQGVYYIDEEDEPVTSIVNGRECVFTYADENGIVKCAIEKAYREGKTDFYKPISCHLYPVRIQKYEEFTAVNVHHWSVCKCGRELGLQKDLPLYEFLKEPLIRRFGEEWYSKLHIAAQEFEKENKF